MVLKSCLLGIFIKNFRYAYRNFSHTASQTVCQEKKSWRRSNPAWRKQEMPPKIQRIPPLKRPSGQSEPPVLYWQLPPMVWDMYFTPPPHWLIPGWEQRHRLRNMMLPQKKCSGMHWMHWKLCPWKTNRILPSCSGTAEPNKKNRRQTVGGSFLRGTPCGNRTHI